MVCLDGRKEEVVKKKTVYAIVKNIIILFIVFFQVN